MSKLKRMSDERFAVAISSNDCDCENQRDCPYQALCEESAELRQALKAERLALRTIAGPAIIFVRDSYEPEAKHDKIRFQNLKAALVACGFNVDRETGDEH